MTKEKLTELLKIAYRWGRDNGEGRSEKNFNDLLDTKAVNEALHIHVVVGQSEQYCECSTPKAFTSDKLYMCCEICDREVED
jgi:hypothetical protein